MHCNMVRTFYSMRAADGFAANDSPKVQIKK